MIYNFVRDNSYFQTLFENNGVISTKDFDNEFNNFIKFLNKKVVNSINIIASKSYMGVVGKNNFILKNIGNGDVVFDKLKDTHYQDNSISFDKFKKIQPYSILYVDDTHTNLNTINITNSNINEGGGILGNFNSQYYYHIKIKIEGKNFYDNSINSNNIAANAITNAHISNDGKLFLLKNIKLEDRHIINNTISNDKFAKQSITYDKLHPDIKSYREISNIFLKYEDRSITPDKIQDNTLDFRLINLNLTKFGYGILHKSVIPKHSVYIQKPDQDVPETIDTYQLCIYSIANAYQLNTYTEPQADKEYINPEYIEKLNLYDSLSKQLVDEENYLNQLYQRCIFKNAYISPEMVIAGKGPSNERLTYFCQYWGLSYQYVVKVVTEYEVQWHKRNHLQTYVQNVFNDLQKIPKNIYMPTPPLVYQKLEAVPNTKSYLLHKEQQVIKSRHLKDNMFNIYNIPDRINYNNVSSEKFINKYKLSPELRAKLGLVI